MPNTVNPSAAPSAVVVVGGANMDISAHVPRAIVQGDSNPGDIQCAPGGVARNVAENLARLGLDVRLITAVGDDLFGRTLLDATRGAGVPVDGVHVSKSHRTATYLSVHGCDGDMAVAVNDMLVVETLTPQVLESGMQRLPGPDCLVADCNLSESALAYLLEHRKTSNPGQRWPWVFVDAVSAAKCKRIAPYLSSIHLLKINMLEAQTLSGMPVTTTSEALAAAVYLRAQGVKQVVVSMGEAGVCWCDTQGHSATRNTKVMNIVNTSGAGDALLAGLVFGTVQKWPLERSIEFAMACAELTLASPYANAPDLSLSNIERQMSTH